MVMFAPMRTISLACMKRFSKIVSRTLDTPSAWVASAMNWACMSVAKPGYSSVVTSAATSFLPARTRSLPLPSHLISTPHDFQFFDDCFEVAGFAIGQQQLATGHRSRDQECAGLDAVGNDRVGGAVQLVDSLNAQASPYPRLRSLLPFL